MSNCLLFHHRASDDARPLCELAAAHVRAVMQLRGPGTEQHVGIKALPQLTEWHAAGDDVRACGTRERGAALVHVHVAGRLPFSNRLVQYRYGTAVRELRQSSRAGHGVPRAPSQTPRPPPLPDPVLRVGPSARLRPRACRRGRAKLSARAPIPSSARVCRCVGTVRGS